MNEPGASTTEAEPGTARRDWLWLGALALILVAPLIVSAVDLWFSVGTSYLPHVDHALIEMRTRDVWHHLVTTGPYSRYGNQHPGPLLFYVLALPYRLLGSRSVAPNITALAVNGLAMLGILGVAMRRGRLPMVVATVLPVTLLVHALGADQLRDPWNAYLPVLPLLLLLLLAWSVAVGDVWMLPVAIQIGSFAAQTHLGFTLEVLALTAIAVVGGVVHAYRHRDTGAWRTLGWSAAVSLGVGIVLWSPVLYGTFVRHDGNMQANIDVFTEGGPGAGLDAAIRAIAPQWGFRPEWLIGARGASETLETPWVGLFGVALLAGSAGVAWWRKSAELGWLIIVLGIGTIAAVISVGSIVGGFADYLVRWTWVLGAALSIVVLRAAWLALPARFETAARRLGPPAVLVVVGLLSVASIRDVVRAPAPLEVLTPEVRALARGVRAALAADPVPW